MMEGALLLSLPPELRIDQITATSTTLKVHLVSTQRACHCPLCGQASEQVHSRYRRMVADVPSGAKPVRLELEVRKFFCRTPTCPRKIFSERLPDLVEPWARTTKRLRVALQALGVTTGAAVGSRLAPQWGMQVRPTTLLRSLRTISISAAQTVQVLGLDDWAFKRGQIYGTILVDLERHRLIDPAFGPPSRNGQSLAESRIQRSR
jgi:transposase